MHSDLMLSPFPNDYIDPKIKATFDYGKKIARSLRDNYQFNNSSYRADFEEITLNRLWAEGTNDPNLFKPFINGDSDSSFLTMDYSIIPIVPKFVDIVVGKMLNITLDINFESIDKTSVMEKNEKRAEYLAAMKLRDFNEQQKKLTGISIIPENVEIIENEDELELHLDLNEKLSIEIFMEECIKHKFKECEFEQKVKPQIARDLAVAKKTVLRTYYDGNGNIAFKYMDVARFASSYTDKPDHSNIEYAFVVESYSVRQLRELASPEVTEEDFFNLAKTAANRLKITWLFGDRYNDSRRHEGADYNYDNYLVDCINFVYFTTDLYNFEKKNTKNGRFYVNKKSLDYEPKQSDNYKAELVQKGFQTYYEGIFALDANVLVNYGRAKNIMRPKGKNQTISYECLSPYIISEPNGGVIKNKSIVARMIPIAKQMQIACLKMQQMVIESAPPGLAIDQTALIDVSIAASGKKITGMDLLMLHRQKGSVIYNGTDPDTQMPMNRKPIEVLDNGVSGSIIRLLELYQFYINQIRDVTGLNEAVDASSPDTKALLGVRDQAIQASNNAFKEITDSFIFTQEKLAKNLAVMIQDKAKFDPKGFEEEFAPVIGKLGVKELLWTKDLDIRRFGITAEANINDSQRAMLMNNVRNYIAAGILKPEDEYFIQGIGNLKKAQRYLTVKLRKYEREKLQTEQAKMQTQGEINVQSAQGAAQAKAMEYQAKAQAEIAVEQAKIEAQMRRDAQLHEYAKELEILKGQMNQEEIKTSTDQTFKIKALENVQGSGGKDNLTGVSMPKTFPRPEDNAKQKIAPSNL